MDQVKYFHKKLSRGECNEKRDSNNCASLLWSKLGSGCTDTCTEEGSLTASPNTWCVWFYEFYESEKAVPVILKC